MPDRIQQRLIAFRKLKGWSQRELSQRSGVSAVTINAIEHGGNWNRDTLIKLETALGIKLF